MDQEVWYEIEMSKTGDDEWMRNGTRTYDSKEEVDKEVDYLNKTWSPYWKYQAVKVTTTREVVS